MEKNYLQSKAGKKKSAKGAAWIVVALAIIFIYVVVKFALSGVIRLTSGGLPTGNEAYEVAQDFVKSTVHSNNVNFPSSSYGIAKKSDSVYLIRSAVEIDGDDGYKKTTNFKVLMQYKGGKQNNMKSWSLLNISEE